MKKKCVVCGLECDGQPRYKDEQGQYLHVSCAEPQVAEPSAPAHPMEMARAQLKPLLRPYDYGIQMLPPACPCFSLRLLPHGCTQSIGDHWEKMTKPGNP